MEAMYAQYSGRVTQALAASGQPRALALAAMLAAEDDTLREHTTMWWQTALQNAGRDVMIYRMALMFMKQHGPPGETGARLREEAARRWLALDAGNLAPLLYMELTPQQLLQQAAAISHHDGHGYATLRWIYARLRQHPPTAQEAKVLQQAWDANGFLPAQWSDMAALSTISFMAASPMPHYHRLRTACKNDALQADPARLAACHRVAMVLANRSTDLIAALLGLRLQMELATSAHECHAVLAKGARLRWLVSQWNQWMRQRGASSMPDYTLRALTDPNVHNEQELIQTLLREHGMDLEPPPQWSGARANDPC